MTLTTLNMNKFVSLIFLSLIYVNVTGQKKLNAGAGLLFKNSHTTLTIDEQNKVFNRSGLGLSKDKKQFIIANDPASFDFPFDAVLLPIDLNADRKEEIFIVYGNSYTSGMIGSNVLLFIKDKAGEYQSNFGFSGASPDILPSKNIGYPDLLIGGPGFEFPIWRWNGKEYVFHKKITDKSLSKIKLTSVESASEAYVRNIIK